MKIRITTQTDSHFVAPNYPCVIWDFVEDEDKPDPRFHISPHPNYMPTDDDIANHTEARFKVPNPEDYLKKLDEALQKNGYMIVSKEPTPLHKFI